MGLMFDINFLSPDGIQDSHYNKIKTFREEVSEVPNDHNTQVINKLESENNNIKTLVKGSNRSENHKHFFLNVFLPLIKKLTRRPNFLWELGLAQN